MYNITYPNNQDDLLQDWNSMDWRKIMCTETKNGLEIIKQQQTTNQQTNQKTNKKTKKQGTIYNQM